MPALGSINRHVVEDSARTAFAAFASFLIARLLRMPEAYWATISTIIVMQCKRTRSSTAAAECKPSTITPSNDSISRHSTLGSSCRGWALYELECDEAVQSSVLRFVHHTHPAAAQLFDDAVMRDGLADHSAGPSHRMVADVSRQPWASQLGGGVL